MNIPNLDLSFQNPRSSMNVRNMKTEAMMEIGAVFFVPGDKSCSVGNAKKYTKAVLNNDIEAQNTITQKENKLRKARDN